MPPLTRGALTFPSPQSSQISPYLPPPSLSQPQTPIHVTLTFATSLDSSLSLSPGTQTLLSGPLSKSMTHYLRSRHDAILIGVGTALADNPSLNCRISGVGGYGGEGLKGQPRPVVLDPRGRWEVGESSKVMQLVREGRGRAPFVVSRVVLDGGRRRLLEECGGKVIVLPAAQDQEERKRIGWVDILKALREEGIKSVMIEGGGAVINDLLRPDNIRLVDSIIITIAPTWLGKGGVLVCPDERVEDGVKVPVERLKDVQWIPLGEDVVLCGRPQQS
ncbi:bacterial bifunctional deaminase-reductase [Lindgomyces ingoldianus]|uniref:Bacterial bifunctional deaminase-reductase n=1 Tax=Lindgomyces ingoldianus TaxID=673940 RepID=A0ACB6QQM1_9PLEO|nr:bacterial bifunctional deaminase-reductase [Lindgomyces ingoldianus]KAF2468582.1 bacterial bifunctional deaminase-reductase [Lindgomyces ingoldianus]